MRLYHRTNAAARIVEHGFRDGIGGYLTNGQHTGVWISDLPLDEAEGAMGEALFALDIEEAFIAVYEWIEEGKPYREWMVPAALLNSQAEVKLLNEDEVLEAVAEGDRRRFGVTEWTPPSE